MRYTGDGMSSLRFLSQILVETLKTGSLELFGTLFSFLVNFWNFFIAWLPLASMACVLDCIGLASMNGDYSWLPPSRPEECSCCLHEPPFPPWSCPQSLCNLIGIPLPSIVLLRPSSFPFWVLQLPPPVVRLIMPQTLRMLSVVFLSNL